MPTLNENGRKRSVRLSHIRYRVNDKGDLLVSVALFLRWHSAPKVQVLFASGATVEFLLQSGERSEVICAFKDWLSAEPVFAGCRAVIVWGVRVEESWEV